MKTFVTTVKELAGLLGCKQPDAYGFIKALAAAGKARRVGHAPHVADRGRLKVLWELPCKLILVLSRDSSARLEPSAENTVST